MIHGGSQTGTNFTITPDGREGWAQYFLRRGHAVYVVDQVARGRSAHFSQSQGEGAGGQSQAHRAAVRRARSVPICGRRRQGTRNGPAAARRATRPSMRSTPRSFPRSTAIPSSRSSTATPAWRCSTGSGPPSCWCTRSPARSPGRSRTRGRSSSKPSSRSSRTARRCTRPSSRARPAGSPTSAQERASGLGEVPLTYDPPLKPGEELAFVRQDKPDPPGLVR